MSLENRGRKLLFDHHYIFACYCRTFIKSESFIHLRITRLPEDHYPYLQEKMKKGATYYSRDLPYSFDFLLENFMDPAHIPIAHHSFQGMYALYLN
jgi:hypothetical protein